MSASSDALSLLSAEAVRRQAGRMLDLAMDDKLPHMRVDLGLLSPAADLVLATIRKAYPTLAIPFHSRWRHFIVDREDRWTAIDRQTHWRDRLVRARAAFDLAMVSVLMDAGAGAQWRYRDPVSGRSIGRSEGLAIAGLAMFAAGTFSSDPADPLRVDADALQRMDTETLRRGFQVSDANPLLGLEGRAALLRRLGEIVGRNPGVFGTRDTPRPGGLFDHLATLAEDVGIAAPTILSEVLRRLGAIWPSRHSFGGVSLGDCWRHPAMGPPDSASQLVPLHKLSQWLVYSLIEPLTAAGVAVSDINGLTGLAEYRNGGLFIDTGVLTLRNPGDSSREHDVGSPLIVEWRALTVALLDRIASIVRDRLGMDAVALPLAKVLEGGTWAAGRFIARERRADGSPPLRVASDGTVF